MSLPNSPSPSSKLQRPKGSRLARGLNWLLLLMIIGPFAAMQAPREVGRWNLALALELRDRGEKESAFAKLEAAMKWLPDSPVLLLQRAAWQLEDGREKEGLDDAEFALSLDGERVDVLTAHSQLMAYCRRFTDAVADWKKIDGISLRTGRPSRATALNSLAYFQALAGTDLNEAAKNVMAALELEPGEPTFQDTRGYLLYRTNHFQRALEILNLAVAGTTKQINSFKSVAAPAEQPRLLWRPSLFPGPSDGAHVLAVIRYHRALALLALGKEKEAEEDLAAVRHAIGGEPDDRLF